MTKPRSAIRPVMQSGVARALSFVPTAIATLITSRLIIADYGIEAFGSFALVVALIALIPLNDLGVGAAVTSAMAQRGASSAYTARVLLTSARVLTVSTLGVVVVSVALGVAGAWPSLLGGASGSNAITALAMCIFAVSFLPGLGQRMLLGIDRNHVTVVIQIFFTPLILAIVAAFVFFDVPAEWLLVVPPSALVLITLVTAAVAVRAVSFPWRPTLRAVPFRHRHPGESIRAISGPMLVTTLAVPLLLQSDRIVLSHVSTDQAVADYSVALQIFAPVAALVAASAQPLWPIWARARAEHRAGPSLNRIVLIFTGGTAAVCVVLVLVADPIGQVIGNGDISLGWVLPIAAALSIVVQAAAYPTAMKLMDVRGVRFVAVSTALALPLNIGLSIVLGSRYGAPGPLFATFIVGLLVQTVPALIFDRRNAASAAPQSPSPPVAVRPRPYPAIDLPLPDAVVPVVSAASVAAGDDASNRRRPRPYR